MSNVLLAKIFVLYGIGSVMGAAATLVNWLVREFMGGGLSSLAGQPGLQAYYMPMVWGGVFGLLFLLPLNLVSWIGRGIILGIIPGLAQLALKSGGIHRIVDLMSPDVFMRHDTLVVMLVYMFVWGLGTSFLAGR